VPTSGDADGEGFVCTPDQAAIYELAYSEGIRVLDEQAATREQLRLRIAAVLTTATTGTAFLVGVVAKAASSDQDGIYWAGVIVGALLYSSLLFCTYKLVRPKQIWRLNNSPETLISGYAEGDPPATLPETHRQLALFADENISANQTILVWMQQYLSVALLIMIADLVTWAALVVKVA
jgi:hypothetical protein